MRVLVVTAVLEEAEAVGHAVGHRPDARTHAPVGPYRDGWLLTPPWGETQLLVGGVGPAAAAASTAAAIARSGPYDLVLDAGVAGGFPDRAGPGAVVLADRVVAADLGAETPGEHPDGPGFTGLDAMGFGEVGYDLDHLLVARAAAVLAPALDAAGFPPAVVGTVLTVSTVTGTPASTARLAAAHPDAVAEAMEGFGVVTAAAPWGLPVLEVRAVCNPVGVSDRTRWDLPGAFAALGTAVDALLRAAPELVEARP